MSGFLLGIFISWREHHQSRLEEYIKAISVYLYEWTMCIVALWGWRVNSMISCGLFRHPYCGCVAHLPSSILSSVPIPKGAPFWHFPYHIIYIPLFPFTFFIPSSVFTFLPLENPPISHFSHQITCTLLSPSALLPKPHILAMIPFLLSYFLWLLRAMYSHLKIWS